MSAALGYLLVHALSQIQGILVHGAFLFAPSGGHAIVGPSGAGKSTLAEHATGYVCAHDDKVAVRWIRGQWVAYSVPLLDNHRRPGKPCRRPLRSIHFPVKSRNLALHFITPRETIERLLAQVIVPEGNIEVRNRAVATALQLGAEIQGSKINFRRGDDTSELLAQADRVYHP